MTAGPIFRAQLRSKPANGHVAFIPHIRKLVIEFCDKWPSSYNTRTFLTTQLQNLARENPHVEVVVRQRHHKEPIIRGFYANGRDKVISLQQLEVTGIQKKIQLLLESSGAKIKPLKSLPVQSTTESPRGIWSGLHANRPSL
ncbi:mitochondrial ribosomal protein subunit L51 [Coprinopsis marcescibilis]|uniref:Large ribosomal subunit protein mL43 n=1 Tax=Coprinopsis marcescibilis TaxID=230819 RepID=A0A5C3LCY4_COPMA|nr:mitochondrial ribosomal protein subunit L51 [Coprinopsis marcescibilis]